MRLIDQLLNAGIEQNQDYSVVKEKRIFNTFLFGSIVIIIPLTLISILSGKMVNYVICSSSIIFLLFLYAGARNGFYVLSKHLYIYFCMSAIIGGSIYNYTLLRFNGVENLMFPLLLASTLLFRTRDNLYQIILIIASLVGLLFIRQQYEYFPFNDEFAVRMVLDVMIALAVFILTQIYKFNEKLLVKKMTKQKDILYALIDHVPVMMSLIDTDKRFQIVNKPYADFLNMNREEMIGVKCEKILPELITEKHKEWCYNATTDKAVKFNDEINLDGKKYFFTGKYVPIKDKNGDVEFVSQHLVDISELKQVEASLKEANEAKNKILSMLAHDIRSPLAMLSSTMKLDQNRELTEEEFIWLKDNINTKLTNLIGSLNTLLDWSRYQLNGLKTEKSNFCIYQLLTDCIEAHQDFADLKGIEVRLDCNVNRKVSADLNHIRLVVKNLLHNALKFSEKGNQVTITAHQKKTDVILTISDTGIGMSPEQVKSILAGAIQQSAHGTSGEKGNGLGLSLSMGLLNLGGLEYSLNSAPGEGTQFAIQIPILEEVLEKQYT
ncbi:MAG: ATP-binding protein [Bacteroidota bacterium]